MNGVSKTRYIPLFGKTWMSRRQILLCDPKAEEIWEKEGFPLKGKAKSKWLAYYMGIRAAVFDTWLAEQMERMPNAVILHIGCGMDSRICRVGARDHLWYDVDFPDVIEKRRKYYTESASYRMIGADAREEGWLETIPGGSAIVVLEGFSMYLTGDALRNLLASVTAHFLPVRVLVDCYTVFAAKASQYKNPVNEVGVTQLYGIDDPRELEEGTRLHYLEEQPLTPEKLIAQIPEPDRAFFKTVFANAMGKKIYRLFEYETG